MLSVPAGDESAPPAAPVDKADAFLASLKAHSGHPSDVHAEAHRGRAAGGPSGGVYESGAPSLCDAAVFLMFEPTHEQIVWVTKGIV